MRFNIGEQMKTGVRTLDDSSRAEVAREVADVLLGGGICVIPTDTLYGIVALEQFSATVRRIYDIKNRALSKPFIRLIGKVDALSTYTDQKLPASLEGYWPGPLTIILRGKGEYTVAVRFPDTPFLTEVFSHVGNTGIVAPSANISGESNIFDCAQLVETFQGLVDLIVCQEGGLRATQASTIVDITQKPWKILRQGALSVAITGRDQ
jgi:tRNA threonylcarbamoyl adenosine modification protein (Sua5/YciO/YrdC/YwlC family)